MYSDINQQTVVIYKCVRCVVLLQCHEMALSGHEEIVKVLSELQSVSVCL